MLSVRYSLTREDLAGSAREYFQRRYRRVVPLLAALGLAALIVLFAFPVADAPAWVIDRYTGPLLVVIFLAALNLVYFRFYVPWWAARQVDASRLPLDVAWRFGEEGIDVADSFSESKMDWKSILFFKETPGFFYLFLTKIIYQPVPKRAFPSPEEEAAFRSLLERKLGPPR